jgi:glutaredoxin
MNTILRYLLIIPILILPSRVVFAQWSIDTSKRTYPSAQIENFLKGIQPAFYTSVEISVFGNEGCGHCQHLEELFKADSIPYTFYDINKSKDNYNIMLELVDKVDKGNRSFYYPVVLVNDKLTYSIFKMEDFVTKLRKDYFGYKEE